MSLLPRSSDRATRGGGFGGGFVGVFLLLLACGGPDANSPGRALPPYTGHTTELFDDVIEPRAVGMNLEESVQPRTDPTLRERTQTGDGVVKVRVETVTGSGDGETVKYELTLRVLASLAGQHPPQDTLTVFVDKSSPSIGILKSFDTRLGGKTFVAFVREFQTGEDRRFHFHFAPDTKDVAAAVKEAVDLSE